MKAVIMAGGEGTRLRPLTSNQPKPMLPLGNRPMMEHIVRLLKEHGFDADRRHRRLPGQQHPHLLRRRLRLRGPDGVRRRGDPAGTAGSVRNAMAELTERFLVISGDVLTDIDLGSIVRLQEQRGAVATIGLKSMEIPLGFGIVITDEAAASAREEQPNENWR